MTKAARQARWRAMRRKGRRIARVEIDDVAVTEMLIASRWLKPADADDPRAVDAALAACVAALAAVEIR